MAELEFTPAQDRAIRCIDTNVAVSAGAGSGKTRVLVQRFLYILSLGMGQPEKKVLPKNVLAVTFTRKAAAEMLERIRKEMELRAADSSDSAYWEEQMKGLSNATVGTIHSFCSSLLRAHPVECGLDPNFIIMEEYDYTDFLKKEIRDTLRSLLHKQDAAASALCREYGSRSLLEQTQKLLQKGIKFRKGDLLLSYTEQAEEIRRQALQLRDEFTEELADSSAPGNRNVLAPNLGRIRDAMLDIDLPENVSFLREIGKKLKKTGKNKDAICTIKDRLETVALYSACRKALTLIPFWEEYLLCVQETLGNKKRQQGMLGFDDLEEMALELLEQHPDVLAGCRRRFRYVMVDEFQDTNERQRQLVYLLCGGDKDILKDTRLFVVGDPKQSIYRFRGADVSVFARVRKEIEETGGESICLNDNFRTVAPVLDFCNKVFPDLMGMNRGQDVFYEALEAHRDSDRDPELCVFHYNSGDSVAANREKEAHWLAQRLQALHKEGTAYKDMAVLLQKMTHVSVLTDALREQHVPCAVVDGRGFYDRIEILDMIHLFSFVSNPHDNLNLAGVLRSVYFGLHDEQLTRLLLDLADYNRNRDVKLSLWDFLLQSYTVAEKETLLSRCVLTMKRLLTAGTVLNLPDFCRELQCVLHPEMVLAMQKNGEEQLADIRKFFRMADAFAAEKNGTVRDFGLHLLQMKEEDVREAAADVQTDDAVLLMTVHKSKGLEFPVVAIPFMDARGQANTDTSDWLPDMGLGISVRDDEGLLSASSVLKSIKETDKEKEQEEKIRLLYVAMTRARDRLIMSGGLADTKGNSSSSHWMRVLLDVLPEGYEGILRTDIAADAMPGGQDAVKPAAEIPELSAGEFELALQNIRPLDSYGGSSLTWFSASSLQEYAYCQRRYYYQAIEEIPALESQVTHGDKLPAAALGSLVHEVLEKYAKWRMAHQYREEEEVWRGFYRESAEELTYGRPAIAGEVETLLQGYLRSELYQAFSVHQKYAEYGFQLPLLQHGGHTFTITGFIDGIAEMPDGSLQLVDYKSGQVTQDGAVSRGYAWQLALYKMAAETLLQKPVKTAALHFIRNCSEWKLPDEDYRQEIAQLCSEIADKKEESDFNVNTNHCDNCPFSYMCRKN